MIRWRPAATPASPTPTRDPYQLYKNQHQTRRTQPQCQLHTKAQRVHRQQGHHGRPGENGHWPAQPERQPTAPIRIARLPSLIDVAPLLHQNARRIREGGRGWPDKYNEQANRIIFYWPLTLKKRRLILALSFHKEIGDD